MKIIDLSGQRFGSLTVLSKIDGCKRTTWKCVCDCGKEVNVLGDNLRHGKSTSCGCSRRKPRSETFVHPSFVDITGKRFGHLVAMRYDHERNRWLCSCDCGGTCWCNVTELRTNRKDCGCSAAEAAGKRVKAGYAGHRLGTQINTIMHVMDGRKRSNNTTGVTGVRKKGKRYQARITVRGQEIYLGSFRTVEEASIAREEAEKKYFQPLIDLDNAIRESRKE